jgi:hypothetical protein
MSSPLPNRDPEGPQWQNQPQGGALPDGEQYPPPQPSASFPQQPGYAAQQPYPPMPPQTPKYQPVPQYAGPQFVAAPKANGPGIASLVLGIIGVLTSVIIVTFFIGLPVSIAGLVLAVFGMRRTSGKGLAIAGRVLSIIGIVVSGIVAILFFIGLATGSLRFYSYPGNPGP